MMGTRKYFLQLDNCRIHTTVAVKAWASEAQVPLLMGVPYCPQYSGIETFWAGAKRTFRQLGTKVILSGAERNLMQEAMQSVLAQTDQFAMNCARGGIKSIMHITLPGEEGDVE